MAEIINLRQTRKARKRADDAAQAEQNRARFGRTKGEKERDRMEAERLARRVDGARLEGQESVAGPTGPEREGDA